MPFSSRVSSTVTMRSPCQTSFSRAFINVVLPLPVPPVMSMVARCATRLRSTASQGAGNMPWRCRPSSVGLDRAGKRMEIDAPWGTSGAMAACTRTPRSSQASAMGRASSSLRPSCEHNCTAYSRTVAGERNAMRGWYSIMPCPRSTQILPSQVIATSVMLGSPSSSSNGPSRNTAMGNLPREYQLGVCCVRLHRRASKGSRIRSASAWTASRLHRGTAPMPSPSRMSPHRRGTCWMGPRASPPR